MDHWKCFLGVRSPPHAGLVSLLEELRQLGRGVRTVAPADLHVTLKFLGPTPVDDIPRLASAVSAHLADQRSSRSLLTGLGAFPSPTRPSVVWAGVEPQTSWFELADRCEAACQPLGFPREHRPYRPHLTLARIAGRAPRGLETLLANADARTWGELPITAVELLRSEATHGPPRYSTVARFPLSD